MKEIQGELRQVFEKRFGFQSQTPPKPQSGTGTPSSEKTVARAFAVTAKKESLHDVKLKDIDGKAATLGDYEGKVLLVVNVASECGLTYKYAGRDFRLTDVFGKVADKIIA